MKTAENMEDHTLPQDVRIIVAGGRDFADYAVLRDILGQHVRRHAGKRIVIISGHARGADILGERFAREMGLALEIYPADWENLGKRAGFVRNSQMVATADALVAFWDGTSRGTLDTIKKMQAQGKPVAVYAYSGAPLAVAGVTQCGTDQP